MEREKILENSKLIVEFMGYLIGDVLKLHGQLTNELDTLYKWHLSWDWLMPVINKITTCNEWDDYPNMSAFWDVFCQLDITNTFEEVVKFIEWRNKL